jgi:hypothetical protein
MPYGQFLLGFAVNRFDAGTANVSRSDTVFMFQPGGGVHLPVGSRWGLFGQIDLRRSFLDEEENLDSRRSDVRLWVGLRFAIP